MSTFKDISAENINSENMIRVLDKPIIENGTNDHGWYIKLHGGIVIGGRNYTRDDIGITNSYGILYQSLLYITLPISLKDQNSLLFGCLCKGQYGTGASWGTLYSFPAPDSICFRIFDVVSRPAGSQTCQISYVYGGYYE